MVCHCACDTAGATAAAAKPVEAMVASRAKRVLMKRITVFSSARFGVCGHPAPPPARRLATLGVDLVHPHAGPAAARLRRVGLIAGVRQLATAALVSVAVVLALAAPAGAILPGPNGR